jgi:putative FmdB family regulatory protein
MPTYEYECALGHRREAFRSISQRDEELECDACGACMRRIPSVPQKPYIALEGGFKYEDGSGI